ncbi:hypothetical protein [Chryseobacterium sp.]|uniref:hypothetical protein n=1 Tax=Chryseobacterium sp. TaxID=1871047 RepID=UPI0031CDAF58
MENTKIDKLNKVIAEWENKAEGFFKESAIARKHNYPLEALNLDEKYRLVRDMLMDLKMKVVEELIEI